MSQSLVLGLTAFYVILAIVGLATDTAGASLFAAGELSVQASSGSNQMILRAPYKGVVNGEFAGIRPSSIARVGARIQPLTQQLIDGRTETLASDTVYRITAVATTTIGIGAGGAEPRQALTVTPALARAYPAGTKVITEELVRSERLKTPKEVRPDEGWFVGILSWPGEKLDQASGVLKFVVKIATMDYALIKHEGEFFGILRMALAVLQFGTIIMLGIFLIRTVRGF